MTPSVSAFHPEGPVPVPKQWGKRASALAWPALEARRERNPHRGTTTVEHTTDTPPGTVRAPPRATTARSTGDEAARSSPGAYTGHITLGGVGRYMVMPPLEGEPARAVPPHPPGEGRQEAGSHRPREVPDPGTGSSGGTVVRPQCATVARNSKSPDKQRFHRTGRQAELFGYAAGSYVTLWSGQPAAVS